MKKLKLNKIGDFEISMILQVLIGVILLVMISYLVIDYVGDDYNQKVIDCNIFISNVDGKPKYFSPSLDKITYTFIDSVSQICPSKNVNLEKSNLVDSAKLVRDCYNMIGSGNDFFGANVVENSTCIHCGFIKVNDDLNDFNKRFSKELNKTKYFSLFEKDSELYNTNEIFLSEKLLVDRVSSDDYLRVLAFAYKPGRDFNEDFLGESGDTIQTGISSFFGEYLQFTNYLVSDSSIQGFSGVAIEKFENYGEFDNNRTVEILGTGSGLNCGTIIVPQKNYE